MKDSNALRIMIYDKSKWAGALLTTSWFAGGGLYKLLRRRDICQGFDNWSEALNWIATVQSDKKISSIQFWGHGSWGDVWMNDEPLNTNITRKDNPLNAVCKQIRDRLTDDAIIWLRCCSVFGAKRGQNFARRWAKFFNCTIAAHTYIIGPFQSGLHTIRPGEDPSWDSAEGLEEGTPDKPVKCAWSNFWKPKTIFCLRGTVPKGW